jgi:hypothetical protein
MTLIPIGGYTMRFVVLGTAVALAGLMASQRGTAAEGRKNDPQLGKVRHVVLFKFKDGTTGEQQKTVEDAFRGRPGKIHEVAGFEWGTNISPENRNEGFTHCFRWSGCATPMIDLF